jgi:hypothetical protein
MLCRTAEGNMHTQDVYGFNKEVLDDPSAIKSNWLLSDGTRFVQQKLRLMGGR